jgi:HD-like signal output (HDOD) protein
MLFEHLQGRPDPALLDALNMSFYSAILGRSIAGQIGLADREETFISALFHNLGRTLVALYLPAESQAIQAGGDTAAGARSGCACWVMSYASIGVAVARALNLPEQAAAEHEPRDRARRPTRR